MILKKITEGYVTQTWDTDKKEWTGQSFTAQGACDYEDEFGEIVSSDDFVDKQSEEPYLPFDMVQPESQLEVLAREDRQEEKRRDIEDQKQEITAKLREGGRDNW